MLWERLKNGLCGAAVTAATLFSLRSAVPLVKAETLGAAGRLLGNPAAALYAAQRAAEEQERPAVLLQEESLRNPAGEAEPEEPGREEPAAPAPTAEPMSEEVWDGVLPDGAMPTEEVHYGGAAGENDVSLEKGSIKNCTSLSAGEIAAEAAKGLPFSIEKDSAEPQVLIMHTHTTETYLTGNSHYAPAEWTGRTTDSAENMCAVGEAMAQVLNEAGICTLHSTDIHDYPSYNGSYERSRETVSRVLEQYPSIRVVLDVHRDAIERDGVLMAPVAEVEEGKTAQVMIICGCDKNGNLPNFRQNLRFAAAWESEMETMFPGVARPVLFDYRFYNQDMTTGSLLIEVGGHGNTLEQALSAGRLAAQALAAALLE